MIRIIADVHGAKQLLGKLVEQDGTLLILGDLINFIDYRTYDGIVADINGKEFVAEMIRLRDSGDREAARALWTTTTAGKEREVRDAYDDAIAAAYDDIGEALGGARGYVTHGNVDRPELLAASLPRGMEYVDGVVVEVDGVLFGFAGGGMPSALGLPGEVTEDVMEAKLAQIGAVDVLCTHLPPAIPSLANDVVGGRVKGSEAILSYLRKHRPAYHYFGDIHQPQATMWRVGPTRCRNVGYFRATGRAVLHG